MQQILKEDYCSYEVAKLLKEKGFDEHCTAVYEEEVLRINTLCYYYNSELSSYICAPTHQMAMKWLREVHHIFIQVELYSKYNDYCFELFQNTHRLILEKHETYNNYEEAVETALKYSLEKLI